MVANNMLHLHFHCTSMVAVPSLQLDVYCGMDMSLPFKDRS